MGRLCVVTGGNKGIGRAVVNRMAATGYEVIATGRDEQALQETSEQAPAAITTAVLDVTDPTAVEDLLTSIPVDVLVNNAGIAISSPVHRSELSDWEYILRVNATGPFLCIRACLPGMQERSWGRIITIGSVESHVGSKYLAAYAASKHAVLGLTRAVAAEVAGTGVTANTVSPVYVDTLMTDAAIERIASVTELDTQGARDRLAGMSPLGRLLDPEEIAHVVSFLAEERSSAINGQSIILDGGGSYT